MSRSPVTDEVIWERWQTLMNLSPAELEEWLESADSHRVGFKGYGAESVGHASGRYNLSLLETDRHAWSPADWRQARRTVNFMRRHLAQRPEGDLSETRWRWSLMNWGHDPLR